MSGRFDRLGEASAWVQQPAGLSAIDVIALEPNCPTLWFGDSQMSCPFIAVATSRALDALKAPATSIGSSNDENVAWLGSMRGVLTIFPPTSIATNWWKFSRATRLKAAIPFGERCTLTTHAPTRSFWADADSTSAADRVISDGPKTHLWPTGVLPANPPSNTVCVAES